MIYFSITKYSAKRRIPSTKNYKTDTRLSDIVSTIGKYNSNLDKKDRVRLSLSLDRSKKAIHVFNPDDFKQ